MWPSAVEVHRATSKCGRSLLNAIQWVSVLRRLSALKLWQAILPCCGLYFEKTGVVPKTHVASWTRNVGQGRAASALVTDAHLSLALAKPLKSTRPSSVTHRLSRMHFAARSRRVGFKSFLNLQRARAFGSYLILATRRWLWLRRFLLVLSRLREKLCWVISAQTCIGHSRISSRTLSRKSWDRAESHRRRDEILERDPRCVADLQYLEDMARSQPDQLEAALNGLGYGKIIRDWHGGTTARLEGALSQVTGDELEAMVPVAFKPAMTTREGAELKKLCDYIKESDLRPQTRAKLVGGLVDNPLFYKHDELLAEASGYGDGPS